MFLQFYGLREQPFGMTPDPRFLYLSASHREALASLYYGVQSGRGFSALIAPPGTGKTTMLFRLLERWRQSARTAFLFHTQCSGRELLRYILADFGIDAPGEDVVAMHDRLNEVLLEEQHQGRRCVVIIDEAQNLDESALEAARLLSDFETPQEKLLQFILAGQPQLAEMLARPSLAQLRQRISIISHLDPFTGTEIAGYIEHRLRVAGHQGQPLFTQDGVGVIARATRGIPRNIDNLCFNALSIGCALGRPQVDAEIVEEALADLNVTDFDSRWMAPAPRPSLPPRDAESQPLRVAVPVLAISQRQPARRSRRRISRPLVGGCIAALLLLGVFGSRVPARLISPLERQPVDVSSSAEQTASEAGSIGQLPLSLDPSDPNSSPNGAGLPASPLSPEGEEGRDEEAMADLGLTPLEMTALEETAFADVQMPWSTRSNFQRQRPTTSQDFDVGDVQTPAARPPMSDVVIVSER